MVSTDGHPQIDCVLQVLKRSGEHETILFTCTAREFDFLSSIIQHMPDSLRLTRVSDGPAN